jgi:hypothetical protein
MGTRVTNPSDVHFISTGLQPGVWFPAESTAVLTALAHTRKPLKRLVTIEWLRITGLKPGANESTLDWVNDSTIVERKTIELQLYPSQIFGSRPASVVPGCGDTARSLLSLRASIELP